MLPLETKQFNQFFILKYETHNFSIMLFNSWRKSFFFPVSTILVETTIKLKLLIKKMSFLAKEKWHKMKRTNDN